MKNKETGEIVISIFMENFILNISHELELTEEKIDILRKIAIEDIKKLYDLN